MPPKLPNSFSSLCAHRAAGSKNATAQSSNDASFGDLREEASSSSRLSLRRRGTLPHRGMQIYEEMSETTNFCRVLPPILRSSPPNVPSFSHSSGLSAAGGQPLSKTPQVFLKSSPFLPKTPRLFAESPLVCTPCPPLSPPSPPSSAAARHSFSTDSPTIRRQH